MADPGPPRAGGVTVAVEAGPVVVPTGAAADWLGGDSIGTALSAGIGVGSCAVVGPTGTTWSSGVTALSPVEL